MNHPLAHRSGIVAMCALIAAGQQWRDLTKAQQRTLLDPASGTARPIKALNRLGLLNGVTPTHEGYYLRHFAVAFKHRKAGQ